MSMTTITKQAFKRNVAEAMKADFAELGDAVPWPGRAML